MRLYLAENKKSGDRIVFFRKFAQLITSGK